MVRASLAAHRVQPELHRVLEREFPFFDAPKDESPANAQIFQRVRRLLEDHCHQIAPPSRDLATWIVLQTMESLVHSAVIDAPQRFTADAMDREIVAVLMGYLEGATTSAAAEVQA